MKRISLFGLFIFLCVTTIAQNKLTNELIWGRKSTFNAKSVDAVRSMNDGLHFTAFTADENGNTEIAKFSFETYDKVGIIASEVDMKVNGASKNISIQSYDFNKDETKLLIATEIEYIYRRSFSAKYFVYDIKTKTTTPLSIKEGKQLHAEFSPDGSKIAFVRDNNLFVTDLIVETKITHDGKYNSVINGATDWVYEEEFAIAKGFEWNASGDRIAFYKFDEGHVKEFQMAFYGNLYPDQYKFKYPKAGEENAHVTIHMFNLNTKKTEQLITGNNMDQYIPRIKWTQDPEKLVVQRMNRHQNHLEYILFHDDQTDNPINSVKHKIVYEEKSKTYIEIDDNLIFLKDGKSFIRTSEKNGYNHIYKIDFDGNSTSITDGKWDVVEFKGVDEKKGLIYYTSAEEGAMYQSLYVTDFKGKKKTKLSEKKGKNSPVFSKGMKYYINYHSSANTPSFITLHNAKGKQLKVLEDNAELNKNLESYNLSKKEFITVKTANGDLNGWMIKPPNFDPNKKYPVYVNIYCGPGHNTVMDSWDGRNYFWHQLLAQEGYIVFSVDPRGTMYRGEEFKKSTYLQLGKLETEDMIESAKWLANQPYVDGSRIGIQGWSYGGYMTSLCMTKGADFFKMGIAVAPVTNWKYYDSIYTERFMRTPKENNSGYEDNSPINFVEQLKGKYLLVHGSADDNVHHQNTMDMITALVNANKQFDLFIYPNKNHGIYGGNTRLHLFTKMLDFVKTNL